jgi:hypothetical protein
VVPGLVGVLAVVVAPVVAVEDLGEAVELALAAAGQELAAEVAEAPVRVAALALAAEELAVVDPVAGRVWVAESVVAEERQHLVSG